MVPGVDNAAPHVFALGGGLLDAGGFANIDGEVGLGPGHVDVAASAAGKGGI